MVNHYADITVAVLVGSIFGYLGLNGEAIGLYATLLLVDFITGVLKAHKLRHPITSSIGIKGAMGKVQMMLLPFSIAVLFKIAGLDGTAILVSIIATLAMFEVYSIIGNIHSYNTGEEVTELEATTFLLRAVKKLIDQKTKD